MLKLIKYYKRFGLTFLFRFYLFHFKHFLGFPALKYIFISTWHECNANCKHCYEKFDRKTNSSLTTEQVKDIINQFYKLNGILIYFCSGEFLLRPDALELISYARKKNILVSVVTNGIVLNDTLIDKLKEVDLNRLIVSLDNVNSEKHDENRGVKGLFNHAIEGIKKASQKGIRTQIWTFISRTNNQDLVALSKLSKKVAKEPVFVFFPLLSGHLFNSFDENFSFEEREEIRKKYNGYKEIMLEFPYEKSVCRGGGNEHINIMPDGEVTFCPPVPYSYGNVLKEPLKKILPLVKKDYQRFFKRKLTGQCPVNFIEYRNKNNGRYIYD
ncbi:MAG: radical SAM protein [Bacteroidales bacterium]|nr:radical SAM protein [Bacteroidales bacterium]